MSVPSELSDSRPFTSEEEEGDFSASQHSWTLDLIGPMTPESHSLGSSERNLVAPLHATHAPSLLASDDNFSSVSMPTTISALSSTAHMTTDERTTVMLQRVRELEAREVVRMREVSILRNRTELEEAKSAARDGVAIDNNATRAVRHVQAARVLPGGM